MLFLNYPYKKFGGIMFNKKKGYQLKAGQPAKSSNCAERRKLFIAGLWPNPETSEPEFLSRLKLVAIFPRKNTLPILIKLPTPKLFLTLKQG